MGKRLSELCFTQAFLDMRIRIKETIATIPSLAGKDNQTPVIPSREDIKIAMGIIITSPFNTDIICAGMGLSIEVKKVEVMVLNPINNMAVKYSSSPIIAIC